MDLKYDTFASHLSKPVKENEPVFKQMANHWSCHGYSILLILKMNEYMLGIFRFILTHDAIDG